MPIDTMCTCNFSSKFPKSFTEYLKQMYGIDLTTKATNLKEAWIKFWYTRDFLSSRLNTLYNKIQKRLLDSQHELHLSNEMLKEQWSITHDIPCDFSKLHSTNWNSPFKAFSALKNFYEQIYSRREIRDIGKELDARERATWLAELLQKAREQNATFVVIKNQKLIPVYQENIDAFNKGVAKRENCSVYFLSLTPMWLACQTDVLQEILPTATCLSRNECTVEFFS